MLKFASVFSKLLRGIPQFCAKINFAEARENKAQFRAKIFFLHDRKKFSRNSVFFFKRNTQKFVRKMWNCTKRFSYSAGNRILMHTLFLRLTFFCNFHFHFALLSFYVEERKKLKFCFGKNLS